MSGLTIGWEYLTGYAVATDPASRDRAEWPPHPARVFMALAAAWFETGEDASEGEALRWLETLGDPQLNLPRVEGECERSLVTIAVPPNYDQSSQIELWWKKQGRYRFAATRKDGTIGRKPATRAFPRIHVGNAACSFCWPSVQCADKHRDALDRLCSKVTRLGHSSSLVRMWVGLDGAADHVDCENFVVDDLQADFHARQVSSGFLDTLIENFGKEPRQRKEELDEQIEALTAEKKSIKGKGAQARKGEVDKRLRLLKAESETLVVRAPVRPKAGLWSGYRRAGDVETGTQIDHTYFDTDLLVLARIAGPELPLISTFPVTHALRGAVMKHSGLQPAPHWVSGHEPGGERAEHQSGHMACIPLPFVGHEHADGHLLGVGLVFPRSEDRRNRGRVLGPLLLHATTGQPRPVELLLGRLGVWTLQKSGWNEQRGALQPEAWTAHPRGATTWASVTPVVLDRFPKADRGKDRSGWTNEVAVIVVTACKRIGLPEPESIEIGTTSWHRGVPRAVGKRRRLRGRAASDRHADSSLGSGFPPYPAKGTNAARVQVHVWLRFSEPVIGPVVLGAGRFQGYGLCKPWREYRG